MSITEFPSEVSLDDALRCIVEVMKVWPREVSAYGRYGYDLYIPNVALHYLETVMKVEFNAPGIDAAKNRISPAFLTAAWELCRKGILRPGVASIEKQSTDPGHAGGGFSLTKFGRDWLKEGAAFLETVPLEQSRFSAMLDAHAVRFGPAFRERAHEAYRCHFSHAYLACCAMCGAAAEAILLSVAIAKSGDEAATLKTYNSSKGRSRIEASVTGKVVEPIRRDFNGFIMLLKYWRDDAAHGAASLISENEAFTALAMLLRFAEFVDSHWSDLTSP